MDPTLPPTARYYWHYIRQRLGNLRNWISVITGRSGLMRRLLAHFMHTVRHRSDLQEPDIGKPAVQLISCAVL